MKVAELRSLVDKYSIDQLKMIIAEMYKTIPKKTREASGIDNIIQNAALPAKSGDKTKEVEEPDIDFLEYDIDEFIENAYNQYYFIPNMFVSKRERPKWRFEVKRFYKELLLAANTQENLPTAAQLLEKLYQVLCFSCTQIIFRGYDSFQSIGIEQPEFFRRILSLKIQYEDRKVFIKNALLLMINTNLNRETLHSDLMHVILEFLKTPELREMAIAQCTELLEEIKRTPAPKKDDGPFKYQQENNNNNLTEMGFLCYAQLYEYENGIAYFKKYYRRNNSEVALYILLKLLFEINQKDCFLQEYEKALKIGVLPREELTNTYNFIKENGKLPQYIR